MRDCDSVQTMSRLSDDDILAMSPLVVFALVSRADGFIDARETATLQRVSESLASAPFLRAALQDLIDGDNLKAVVGRIVEIEPKHKLALLREACVVLDASLSRERAISEKRALLYLGRSVAQASGKVAEGPGYTNVDEAIALRQIAQVLGLEEDG